jgi:hypothetical protein
MEKRRRRDWEKEGDRERKREENLRMRDLFSSCSSAGRERETQENVKNIWVKKIIKIIFK